MELSPSQRVEIALRAGQLAKSALELTSANGVLFVKAQLMALARQLREIDDFVRKAQADAKA